MTQVLTIAATLEPRGAAGAFLLTEEQVAALGSDKKAFAVRVTVNGVPLASLQRMSYTHRKEYVRWITEAKQEATRADRVATTIEMVRAGRTR